VLSQNRTYRIAVVAVVVVHVGVVAVGVEVVGVVAVRRRGPVVAVVASVVEVGAVVIASKRQTLDGTLPFVGSHLVQTIGRNAMRATHVTFFSTCTHITMVPIADCL